MMCPSCTVTERDISIAYELGAYMTENDFSQLFD